MKHLLKDTKRLTVTGDYEPCDVLIEGSYISKIASEITDKAAEVIQCDGNVVLPGFIDVHSHLREPGGEHRETIKTGTQSAARGGFTTICAMPNTSPVPDNVETVKALMTRINTDASVRVLPYAAITKDLQGSDLTNMTELAQSGVFAFTDDGVGIQSADKMLEAMTEAAANNMPVVAHCEDNSLVSDGVIHDGEVSRTLNLPGMTPLSESVQIARDVLLAEASGCHYHVCHVSTKESVRVIRDAKRAGIHVTAEVTPHHLLLNERDITTDNANYKMNPPLRSESDQKALLDALSDGTIDIIATDHAPHAKEEKLSGFRHAPFGIVGFETAFPLLYTYLVLTGKATMSQLIDWLTVRPAEIFQLPLGVLKTGEAADITVVNLDQKEWINKQKFNSKGKNTPFDNVEVYGMPVLTLSKGNIVYKEDLYD